MNACTRRSRGFAVITCIAMIALIGGALVALASWLNYEGRRSRDAQVEAQLRQLLMAGASVAIERAGEGKGSATVTLPPGLASSGGSVVVAFAPEGDGVRARIEARLGGRMMGQWLRVSADRRVVEAVIEP